MARGYASRRRDEGVRWCRANILAAARAVVDPSRILPEATERRARAGPPLAETWSEAGKQPMLVPAIDAQGREDLVDG